MILTDGITSFTITDSRGKAFPEIDKSTRSTAGGNLRSITTGQRPIFTESIRVTPAQYNSLLQLLTNNATSYFYTPSSDADYSELYPDITFPLAVTVLNLSKEWDNGSHFYVNMDIQGISYV